MELTAEKIEILPADEEREPLTISNTGKNQARLYYSELIAGSGGIVYSNLPSGAVATLDGSYKGRVEANSKLGTTILIEEL